jgi:hypothetical protein
MRIAIGAGTHSPWASRVLKECGYEVLVAEARKLKLIYARANAKQRRSMPQESGSRLARRVDPKLLYPLKHRDEDSQAHMASIRSCEALVGCRTQLVNLGYAERSNPSEVGCPNAWPEASTTMRSSTSPRATGRR